ncbi:MAG TPA: hypothetical protein PLL90_09025 [Bacteroidales bacterium]|nr:hypothetical protein [Bacteroidales bacterium]
MKKCSCLILILVSVLFTNATFAQLSTRTNDSSIVRLGARPIAGDMSLSFSYPFMVDGAWGLGLKDSILQFDDYITYRYYLTDNIVLKVGMMYYKSSAHSSGTTIDTAQLGILSAEGKLSEYRYGIVPGAEYHFGKSNIFDVYLGGNMCLGFGNNVTINNIELVNGDYSKFKAKQNTTLVGIGGVIGINVFVANLPLSLGLKYSFNSNCTIGGKTHVNASSKVGTTETEQEFYSQDNDVFGNPDPLQYESLKRTLWNTNHDIRVVLNVYFGK